MLVRYLTILSFLIPFAKFSMAQNLVANGSFELTYYYDSTGNIDVVKLNESSRNWWSYLESYKIHTPWINLYQKNSVVVDDVPKNASGYQIPEDGGSYAGIALYDSELEIRQYLIGSLTKKLAAGKKYEISFAINLANCSKYAINSIGAAVTSESDAINLANRNYSVVTELSPSIDYNGEFLKDTVSWKTIKGMFIAGGGEDKIIIGCFHPDNEIKVIKFRKSMKGCNVLDKDVSAYYLIDNIVLKEAEKRD